MGQFNERAELDDPLDDPRHESEFYQELEDYWKKLDDRQRWSE